jgi:hypothetical protein
VSAARFPRTCPHRRVCAALAAPEGHCNCLPAPAAEQARELEAFRWELTDRGFRRFLLQEGGRSLGLGVTIPGGAVAYWPAGELVCLVFTSADAAEAHLSAEGRRTLAFLD